MILANCRTQKVEFAFFFFFFWNLQKSIQNDNHLPGVTGHVPRKTYLFWLVIRSLTTIFSEKENGGSHRKIRSEKSPRGAWDGWIWMTGWWLQIFFMFTPIPGEIWLTNIFQMGWLKPPRRWGVGKYLEKSSSRNSGGFFGDGHLSRLRPLLIIVMIAWRWMRRRHDTNGMEGWQIG